MWTAELPEVSISDRSPIPTSPVFDTLFDGVRFWDQTAIVVKDLPDAESRGGAA